MYFNESPLEQKHQGLSSDYVDRFSSTKKTYEYSCSEGGDVSEAAIFVWAVGLDDRSVQV